jgi:hypothetical protein
MHGPATFDQNPWFTPGPFVVFIMVAEVDRKALESVVMFGISRSFKLRGSSSFC